MRTGKKYRLVILLDFLASSQKCSVSIFQIWDPNDLDFAKNYCATCTSATVSASLIFRGSVICSLNNAAWTGDCNQPNWYGHECPCLLQRAAHSNDHARWMRLKQTRRNPLLHWLELNQVGKEKQVNNTHFNWIICF